MKKILSLLGTLNLIVLSTASVISCYDKHQSSPNPEDDELFKQKMIVFNVVQEIVEEGIEFEGPFLINYERYKNDSLLDQKDLRNLISRELDSINGFGIFSKLLSKIIYEKLIINIPTLKEQFPDFALKTIFDSGSIDEESNSITSGKIDNISQNKEVVISYRIYLNFSSYEKMDKILYYSKILDNNEKYITIKNRPFYHGGREFVIDGSHFKNSSQKPLFKFKQTSFIANKQEWLDYYYALYENGSIGKAFNSDDILRNNHSLFYKFSLTPAQKRFHKIPENITQILKSEQSSQPDFSENKIKMENFLNYDIVLNNLSLTHFKENDTIGDFKIKSLKLVNSYTQDEIYDNLLLRKIFEESTYDALYSYADGVLIYDLDLIISFESYQSKVYRERLYIYSYTGY